MLKMLIQMNSDKITHEEKYSILGITQTIDATFAKMGLLKLSDSSGSLIYCDTGDARDFGRFGAIVNALKKQQWFMDNVSEWIFYDSDDSDNPDDFSEENLLEHYRQKQTVGA